MAQDTRVRLIAEIDATSKGLVDALKQASSAVNSTTNDWKGQFASLKDATGTIQQSVKNLGDLVKEVGNVEMDVDGIEKVNTAIAAVSGNFASVKADVDDFVARLVDMRQQASALSMPIEDFQRFSEVVKASGVSMEESSQMMLSMQQNINDFVNGVPEAKRVFDKLGITIDQISSNTVTANFQEIVRAINDTIPASERATQNMQMFKASIDKTLAVADQYNKATSRQHGEYASDKDVQNAISLSNAIGTLGERLTAYISKTSDATTISNGFSRSLDDMWNIIKSDNNLLASLSVEYDNYVESLKNSVTSTLDASKAIEIFSTKVEGLKEEIGVIKEMTDSGMGDIISDDDINEAVDKLNMLENFLKSSKEKIKDEIDAVIGIMQQRMHAGAPIDTKEMETAINHVNTLRNALSEFSKMHEDIEIGISDEDLATFKDLDLYLAKAQMSFEGFSKTAEALNDQLLLKEAQDAVKQIDEDVNKLKRDLQNTGKVSIDTRDLEKARYELSLISGKKFGVLVDTREVDELNAKVERLKRELEEIQKQSELGTPVWQPITNAVNRVRTAVNSITGSIRKQHLSWRSVGEAIKSCWTYMTHFKSKTEEAGQQGKTLGMTLKQAAGQLLGMGTAVAVFTKAWQNVNKLVKEYLKNVYDAEEAMMYLDKGVGADDMTRVREKSDTKMEQLSRKLAEFADLYDEEQKTGSELTKAKRLNLQDELMKQYGFEFDMVNGEIVDMDTQIAQKLDELAKSRIEAITAQIEANREVIKGVSDYIKGFGYWHMVGSTITGDKNGESRIEKAQERSTRASEENLELQSERYRLEREGLSLQYRRLRSGKKADADSKAEQDAMEASRREEEERAKRLADANKALEDWTNSLYDTDRQKKIRAIMAKYQQLVEEGADETAARNAAEKALADMLNEEKDERIKKNKELFDALNTAIDAYKSAYAEYLDSQKSIYNAQKEYAKAETDLARQARAERLQRRRDAIARKLQSFGFQLPDGFSTEWNGAAARRRVRRQELDASIQEKLQDWQKGEKVHWTKEERDRLKDYQRLQRKDRQLEAAQRQMQAADKQRQAAETLQRAADEIRSAVLDRVDAMKNLGTAGYDLDKALRNRPSMPEHIYPNVLFDTARNNMNAPGVKGAEFGKQMNYNGALSQLHSDLMEIMRKAYLVR